VFLVLVIQQAKRLSRIIFSSVGSAAVQIFFSKLCHKRQDIWGKKITENKIRVLIFSKLLSEIFLILIIIYLYILINTETHSRKVPVIPVKF